MAGALFGHVTTVIYPQRILAQARFKSYMFLKNLVVNFQKIKNLIFLWKKVEKILQQNSDFNLTTMKGFNKVYYKYVIWVVSWM